MAQIINVAYGDQRLKLGNEMFGRKLNFGTAWDRIRIGIRYRFENAAQHLINAQFSIGVCEGTAHMYKDAACTDWIGWAVGNPYTGVQWSYAAGPPQVYTSGTAGLAVSRINGVDSVSSYSGYSLYAQCADPTLVSCNYVTITKRRNVNYAVTSVCVEWHANSTLHVGENCSVLDFQRILEDQSASGLGNAPYTYGPSPTYVGNYGTYVYNSAGLAYSGNGLWDTLNISWSCSDPQALELADIAVVRLV